MVYHLSDKYDWDSENSKTQIWKKKPGSKMFGIIILVFQAHK